MSIDCVNHPPHYQHPSGVEIIEITRHLDNNRGCAVKYCGRLGRKDGFFQELGKAAFYAIDLKNVESSHPAPREISDKVNALLDWSQKNHPEEVYNFLFHVLLSSSKERVVEAGETLRKWIDKEKDKVQATTESSYIENT